MVVARMPFGLIYVGAGSRLSAAIDRDLSGCVLPVGAVYWVQLAGENAVKHFVADDICGQFASLFYSVCSPYL